MPDDSTINYERLYEFRFRHVDRVARRNVWKVISADIHRRMGNPEVMLDPASGAGEFITTVPARERWAVDRVAYGEMDDPNLRLMVADIFDADLPANYFDGVFVSNFLEHLPSQEAVAALLLRLRDVLRPGGRIAVLGPNFRYCSKQYFDCADHVLALSHVAVDEHLYSAGFETALVLSKYLPYSFRGLLPPSPAFTRIYLNLGLAQRLLGKQYLLIASKP